MSALPSALRLTRCCRRRRCCRWLLLLTCLAYLVPAGTCAASGQARRMRGQQPGDDVRWTSNIGDDVAVYDDNLPDDVDDEYLEGNLTEEKGQYLGSPCELTCNPDLQHVFCDSVTGHCECEKFYPVRLGATKGCAKPKRLGEQCFYRATCTFSDQHATCTQVAHNAVCDCEEGYHRVALSRPSKKVFCAEDLVLITTDVPTLLCIASGIAIFTGMICFVLKLFSRARYSRPRHYANANHAPPMLFSSDTGIPLTLHGRPSSRSSQRSAGGGSLTCAFTRRPSSGGSRGPLVPQSRAGSRRPSLASVHSSTSSARSYSARRLEKERNEKEQRQALQELRLQKQREQQQQQQQQQVAPTPSPRTPHSTDELLPSVEEGKEVFYNEVPTTSEAVETATITTTAKPITSTITSRMDEKSAPATTPTTSIFDTQTAPRASGDIFHV